MAVTLNPMISRNNLTFGDSAQGAKSPLSVVVQEKQVDASKSPALSTDSAQQINSNKKYKESALKNFVTDVAYAWVNFSEITKGVFKGLLTGALVGGGFASMNSLYSGYKKYRGNQIPFMKIFDPSVAMSKTGKFLTPVIAASFLIGNVILAKLNANKKTADVDHMLYSKHRSEQK